MDFEQIVSVVRRHISEVHSPGEVPVNLDGVRVDAMTHRFPTEPDGYWQVQDLGKGSFALTCYAEGRMLGEPLVVGAAGDTRAMVRADVAQTQNPQIYMGPLPEGFARFVKGCQRVGEDYSPMEHPELYGFLVKDDGRRISHQPFPYAGDWDPRKTGRRMDFIAGYFLDKHAVRLGFAHRMTPEHGKFDVWALVMAARSRHIFICAGPYLEREPGYEGGWIQFRAEEIPVGLLSMGTTLTDALLYGTAHDLRFSGVVVGSTDAKAFPELAALGFQNRQN